MDVGNEDKLELGNGSGDYVNYHHSPHVSSELQYSSADFATLCANSALGAISMPICKDDLVPSCSSVSMADSFHPTIWQRMPNPQLMAFNDIDVQSGLNNSMAAGLSGVGPGSLRIGADVGWDAASSMIKGGGLLSPGVHPHSSSPFRVGAAFIERAARFSSFNAGNLADIANPYGFPQSLNPFLQGGNTMNAIPVAHPPKNDMITAHTSVNVSLLMDHGALKGAGDGRSEGHLDEAWRAATSENYSDEAELNGGIREEQPVMDTGGDSSSANGLNSIKKRKRGGQESEAEENIRVGQQLDEAAKTSNVGQNPTSIARKAARNPGKQNSGASDPQKGEYIHVRARRGQATNSHSLAERVRREKISERMKLLQDLVPGCSKVTGKAVMLGEIINYVQSLQRQVEFLSMKLATINPGPDFNLDELLQKDMFLVPSNPSTITGFSPPHPPEPTIYPHGAPTIVNSSDAVSRAINSQSPTSRLASVWQDDESRNAIQIGFNVIAPLKRQDTSTLPQGHMKVEL